MRLTGVYALAWSLGLLAFGRNIKIHIPPVRWKVFPDEASPKIKYSSAFDRRAGNIPSSPAAFNGCNALIAHLTRSALKMFPESSYALFLSSYGILLLS